MEVLMYEFKHSIDRNNTLLQIFRTFNRVQNPVQDIAQDNAGVLNTPDQARDKDAVQDVVQVSTQDNFGSKYSIDQYTTRFI